MEDQEIMFPYEIKKRALNMARCTLALLEEQAAGYTILSIPPELQINLEKQCNIVAKLEAELQDLKSKNESYKRKTNDPNKVIQALRNLDFLEQVKSFRYFLDNNSIGTCIINGQTGYGQEWLLNRLIILLMGNDELQCISVGTNTRTYSNKIEHILYHIGKNLGHQDKELLEKNHKVQRITHTVCETLKKRSLVLILKLEDIRPEKKLWINEFINNVWKEFVEKACKYYKTSHPHKLLLFLVDLDDCIEESLKKSLDQIHRPPSKVSLLKIQKLSCVHLIQWIENHIDYLPTELINKQQSNLQELLTEQCQDGEPLLVLRYICRELGHEWFDLENIWLKY